MNKRVQAYTIIEVTIAMLLAAIVIAITYSVYSIVVRSYSSYNLKHDNMAVLIRLDELLQKDFEKAETITRRGNVLFCVARDKSVKYEFGSDEIVRSSQITDTFKVNVETVNFFFEGSTISNNTSNEDAITDELRIELLFDEHRIPYNYHKHYSSENLMQSNSDAIN